MNQLVPPYIPSSPKIMVVGQSPGKTESKLGRPFVGRAGQIIRKLLTDAGFDVDRDVLWTNVVHDFHKDDPNYKPNKGEVEAATERLETELAACRDKPVAILLLGDSASHLTFSGTMAKITGRSTIYLGLPTFATYHPAALLRATKRQRRASIEEELRHAVAQVAAVVRGEKWTVEIPEYREIDLVEIT